MGYKKLSKEQELQLIEEYMVSLGTVNSSLSSSRYVFIQSLECRASHLMLLHNHPSGIPDPSREDIELTLRIREAGALLGIELLDHIIIGDCQAVSMREQGFWQKN